MGAAAPDLAAARTRTGSRTTSPRSAGTRSSLYFYPKDGTPGCTKEACAFRDAWAKFQFAANVQIYGVSGRAAAPRTPTSPSEQKLPFPILADPDHAWSKAFGVGTTLGMDS